ncbi:MAG: tectonin domain-containing protein [Rhodospirillales bacterium]
MGKPLSQCPSGTFADIGTSTYGCWKCPGGFNRDIAAVNTDKACSQAVRSDKPIFTDYKGANRLSGATSCPAGSFFDPRNGGECWKCPSEYVRNLAAVTESNSCTRVTFGRIDEAAAVFVGAACGQKGGFWDPVDGGSCWSCPAGYERTVLPSVKSGQACGRRLMDFKPATKVSGFGCKVHGETAFWDPIQGGTCWACPRDLTRSTMPVNGPAACNANTFEWKAGDFFNPGLFGFGGAPDVVLKVINQRHDLEEVAVRLGAEIGLSPDQAKRELWAELAEDPTHNMPLAIAVLDHVLNLALGAGVRSGSPEATLIANFERYIRDRRVFAAEEALRAYDNWAKAQEIVLDDRRKNAGAFGGAPAMLGLFSDQTPMPPDFTARVAGSIVTASAMSAPVMAGFATNFVMRGDKTLAQRLASKVFVNRTKTVKEAKELALLMDDVASNVSKAVKSGKSGVSVLKGAFKLSLSNVKLGSALLTSIGPQIVAQVAMIVLQAEFEKNLAKADARPKLLRLIDKAQREPVNLKTISQDQDRSGEIHTFWAMAMTGTVEPDAKTKKAIQDAIETISNPYAFDPARHRLYGLPGMAEAVGAGASGEVWHVGAGGSLYRIDAKTGRDWIKVADSGVAAAAPTDQAESAFLLMTDGSMRSIVKGRMQRISGAASAVAYGGGVNWHIGGGNSIYRGIGGDWQRVNGSAKRIAAGPDGSGWIIGTDDRIHHYSSGQWRALPVTATDISVGPDGAVWRVGMDNDLYRLVGDNKWTQVQSGNIANIAAGIDGSLWYRRSNGQMIVYSPFRPPLVDKAPNNGQPMDTTTTRDIGDGMTVTAITVGSSTTKTYLSNAATSSSGKRKSWGVVSGRASAISVSPAGDVWHIGGSGSVYVMPGGKGAWKQMLPRGAKEIAALPSAGQALVLMQDGSMRHAANGKWNNVAGKAWDISVSADGVGWHVGGGNSVYRNFAQDWERVNGTVSRIAGGKDGIAWAVGTNKRIYRFDGKTWAAIPGEASDVAVGADGSVWHVGGGNTLYRLKGKRAWEGVDEAGKVADLSVGADGSIWVVRPDGAMAAYR